MAFLQGPREALRTDEFDVVAELGPKADRVGVIVLITVDGLVAEASLFSLALFVVAINWLAERPRKRMVISLRVFTSTSSIPPSVQAFVSEKGRIVKAA